jgi:predicted permease
LRTTQSLGGITIPLMQFTLGVSLATLRVKHLPKSFALGGLRLVMGLAVGVGLTELIGLEGVVRGVVILDCAMPAAVINYLFAQKHNRDPDEVAGIVVASTTISLLTIPLILAWLL